jgi:hypothetical protein
MSEVGHRVPTHPLASERQGHGKDGQHVGNERDRGYQIEQLTE